ncbi:MAG: hypothetical protein GWO88_00955 [Planctomycetia bacterium]|nr:hypothetical protein [Planctomycetia bacterium]
MIPVADRHAEYARSVGDQLLGVGIRAHVDDADETVGEKIRRAITSKHPAVIVVGDNDVEHSTVGLRLRGEDSEQRGIPVVEAVAQLAEMARPPR